MKQFKPKKQSKTFKVVNRPGRLPDLTIDRPLMRRVRPDSTSDERRAKLEVLIAQAFTEEKRLVAHALGALNLILNGSPDRKVNRRTIRRKPRKGSPAAVSKLLNLLCEAAPKALSAKVMVREDGSLAAEEKPVEEPKERLSGEQTVIYPSRATLYPHADVVRLYK